MVRRLLLLLVLVAVCVAGGAAAWLWIVGAGDAPPMRALPFHASRPAPRSAQLEGAPPQACDQPAELVPAAAANAATLVSAPWSAFGRREAGWAVYVQLAAREVRTACAPDRPRFADALRRWQVAHGLPGAGAMTEDTLRALNRLWLGRRPFVAAAAHGACPPSPPDAFLTAARPAEGYGGKAVRLRTDALEAYRRLVSAAHAEVPALAVDPRLLTLVSGFRGPDEEAARCAASASCGTVSLARCSAHRTGTAMDLFLSAEPGFDPTSSADANRAAQARSPAYLWLVANADRFGFAPYPFEPWHWEYVRNEAEAQAPP